MKKMTFKLVGAFSLLLMFLSGCSKIAVLNPQGPVARQQYHLIVWSMILLALIFATVLIIFVYVLVRYGRKNSKGHNPENHGNAKLEIVWTVIPIIIVTLLAIPTVKTLFDLDKMPKAAASSSQMKPITIEVTSAQWKWLFRYPKQNIETINYVVIPAGTPVKFQLHAHDAMNSFWVPELGGQQYTMPDMSMKLWLLADHPGNYLGRSANYSGKGFAGMEFHVLAKSTADFNSWTKDIKANKPALTMKKYNQLLKPNNVGTMSFSSYPKSLDKKDNAEMMKMHMKGMSGMSDSSMKGGKGE